MKWFKKKPLTYEISQLVPKEKISCHNSLRLALALMPAAENLKPMPRDPSTWLVCPSMHVPGEIVLLSCYGLEDVHYPKGCLTVARAFLGGGDNYSSTNEPTGKLDDRGGSTQKAGLCKKHQTAASGLRNQPAELG